MQEDKYLEIWNSNTRKRTRYETFMPSHGKTGSYPGVDDKQLERIRARDLSPASCQEPELQAEMLKYIDDEDDEWEDTVEHQSSGVVDIVVTGSVSTCR